MQLSDIKKHYKKIIAVVCVIAVVIFSNCIIAGKIVCRFATKLHIDVNGNSVTDDDVENIKGLYFLKKLYIDNCDTNDLSFLENKNHLTDLSILRQKYDVNDTGIVDWSYLRKCKKLKNFECAGRCTFRNLKDFSEMKKLEELRISAEIGNYTIIESLDGLQDISGTLKALTLNGIQNETVLNLEKFSNLRYLDIENSSLTEIRINSYLETLNISNNTNLRVIYLPSDYGQPENIITNNSPYVNIIYE
ncbi:MAG: hypothetical protein K2K16_00775 [Ruminococcus sp.]|nr:hypothetical protein [Ruminococcus sp.]